MLHLLAFGLSLASSVLGRGEKALLLSGGLQLLWYSRAALALGALVCCTRLFAMLLLNPRLGVLILSCARMYQDVRRLMMILTPTPTPTLTLTLTLNPTLPLTLTPTPTLTPTLTRCAAS